MKAKNNTKCQESLTRKVPGRNAHSPTLHKLNIIQVTACNLKPQINKPQFSLFPTARGLHSLTTVSALELAPFGNSLICINRQASSTSAPVTIWYRCNYECKFVPTTAKALLVYTTECKLQKKHVQYRFMDALKN